MEEKIENVQAQKPTYEQLEREVAGLKGMNNQLLMQLQQINMGNLFKRLDYLFKVVENRAAFTPEFAEKSVKEIENLMTPPAVETSDEDE